MSRRAARRQTPSGDAPRTPRRRTRLFAAILVAVVLAVYGRTLTFEFVEFDDGVTVYENPGLNPVTSASLAEFWQKPYRGIYAPITFAFYGVEALLAPRVPPDAAGREMDPLIFHAGNVLLHAACVLLVFAIIGRLVGDDRAALFGGLIFALHPIQVESVAWVTQTRGLLAFAFGLAAVWLYMRSRRAEGMAWAGYIGATVCFALALLSKPAAAAIPLVVAAIEIGWLAGPWRRAALTLAPWFVMAVALAAITKGEQPGVGLPVTTAIERCCVAGDALAFYMKKVIAPVDLAPVYDRSIVHVLATRGLCWWWVLPVAAVVLALRLRGRRAALVSIAIFAAALAPVLGLVPFEYQTMATVADRYAYLAMLGPALAVSAVLAAYPTRAAFSGAAAIAVVLGSLGIAQSSHWRNDVALFPYAVALNPHSAEMQTGFGNIAFRRDDFVTAERAYRAALVEDPRNATTHRNLGLILERRGQTNEAIGHYRRAIETRSDFVDAQRSLAHALAKIGELAAAVEPYRRAVALAPNEQSAYSGLAVTLLRLDRPGEAETVLREGVSRFPAWAEGHANLAAALAMQDKNSEAADEAREALRLNPGLAEARDTLQKALNGQGQ
jgi:tetratricopeptide (TPR) repeat protein